jgi:general secretion pathway protein L
MPEYLVVRLPRDGQETVEWRHVGDASTDFAARATGDDAPPAVTEDTRVIALVPSARVLTTRTLVPVKGAAKIAQTVPFALEEHLADDIGDLHFAVGRREASGRVAVAVAALDDMATWQETLADHDLRAHTMYAESSLLHPPQRTALLLLEGDTVHFAVHGRPPVVVDIDDLPLLLDTLGTADASAGPPVPPPADEEDGAGAPASDHPMPAAEEPPALDSAPDVPPTRLTVMGSHDALERHSATFDALQTRMERIERRELDGDVFTLLARQAAQESNAVNLLQGNFAPPSQLGALWQQWRVAVVLLAAFLITLVGGKGLQLMRLDAQDSRLRADIAQVLRDACPDVRAIVDPQQQLRNCVAGASAPPGEEELFLTMLTSLAGALGQTPGTRIEQISFVGRKMDLKLKAPGVDSIERVKQMVAGRGGIDLLIEQTRPRPDGVEFQVELSRRPEA